MELVELTSPPSETLPLAAFKAHLLLGSGFSDDSLQDELLEAFLRASMAAIEARTGKALLDRELEWHIERWSDDARQPLPIAPVSEVLGVALFTAQGDVALHPAQDYKVERDAHRPSVRSVSGKLPTISSDGAAAVRFIAGFGPTWDAVPADLQQAVLLLATHFYENRSEAGGKAEPLPFGVTTLLAPYHTVRLFGARA